MLSFNNGQETNLRMCEHTCAMVLNIHCFIASLSSQLRLAVRIQHTHRLVDNIIQNEFKNVFGAGLPVLLNNERRMWGKKSVRSPRKACLESVIMIVSAASDSEITYFTLKVPVSVIDPLSVTIFSL